MYRSSDNPKNGVIIVALADLTQASGESRTESKTFPFGEIFINSSKYPQVG